MLCWRFNMFVGVKPRRRWQKVGTQVCRVRLRMCRSLARVVEWLSASLRNGGLSPIQVGVVVSWSRHRTFTDRLSSFQSIDVRNSTWPSTRGTAIIVIISPTLVAGRNAIHHGLLRRVTIGHLVSHIGLRAIDITTRTTICGSTLTAHYIIQIT